MGWRDEEGMNYAMGKKTELKLGFIKNPIYFGQ